LEIFVGSLAVEEGRPRHALCDMRMTLEEQSGLKAVRAVGRFERHARASLHLCVIRSAVPWCRRCALPHSASYTEQLQKSLKRMATAVTRIGARAVVWACMELNAAAEEAHLVRCAGVREGMERRRGARDRSHQHQQRSVPSQPARGTRTRLSTRRPAGERQAGARIQRSAEVGAEAGAAGAHSLSALW
jgi:hypothetical protein